MQAQLRPRIPDDLDVERAAAAAQGLDRRLLGRETSSKMLARSAPPLAGGDLRRPEEALSQPRAAAERVLDPFDLDQVDPERGRTRGHAHGSVTTAASESELDSG